MTDKLQTQLDALDTEIVDADQENLDAIDELLNRRIDLIERLTREADLLAEADGAPDRPSDDPETEGDSGATDSGESGDEVVAEKGDPPTEDHADSENNKKAGNSESGLVVTFSDTHVSIKAASPIKAQLSGDIRDGKVNLKAGQTSRRKLTGEGNGFVSINDVKYEVPKR